MLFPNFSLNKFAENQFTLLDLDSYLVSFANTYPAITYMYAEGGVIGVLLETINVVFLSLIYIKNDQSSVWIERIYLCDSCVSGLDLDVLK